MCTPRLPDSVRDSLPSSFAWLVVAAGLVGGAVSAAFLGVLALIEELLGPERWSGTAHLVVLVLVGVTVAALIHRLGPTSNVELLVDDIHVIGGRYELGTLRSLVPVSLLCVGAGGTLGPEAPLVQATGALGGRLGRRFGVDQRRFRILTITGMAAGFTALFGSPIGATLFALEIPHRRGIEHSDAILPASVGAMSGYGVYVLASGNGLRPIFDLPGVTVLRPVDLAWAVAAGLASAVVAYAFAGGVRLARMATTALPRAVRPVLGGLALGLLALLSPDALTNGELALRDLTTRETAIGAVLLAAGPSWPAPSSPSPASGGAASSSPSSSWARPWAPPPTWPSPRRTSGCW